MLACQRERFSLPAGVRYLNCAYMAPLAREVTRAGLTGLRAKEDPTSIEPRHFFEEGDVIRRRFAALVGAQASERVAIVPSVSYGMAVAARNTPAPPGGNVVVVHEEFPSNNLTWRAFCQRRGLELRTVEPPPGPPPRGASWNERLLDAIDGRTAVVALPHVHWTDGTLFDLEAAGTRAREVGAALVVDGTQSVGALPFDVRTVRPDALVCAGYKWLLGPYALGVAYFGPRYDDGEPLEEGWINRAGSEDFRGLVRPSDEYRPGAIRYDVGERSNFVLAPMLRAALGLVLEWGSDAVQAYCRRLASPIVAEAMALGYAAEDERWRSAHLFGLRVPPGADPARLDESLRHRRIAVSLRGDAVRVSPHVYNDRADADALLEALRAAL